MGVDVDPAGRDEQPLGVDLVAGFARRPVRRGDPVAVDRDVTGAGRGAGAVDEGAVADDEIVHVVVYTVRFG